MARHEPLYPIFIPSRGRAKESLTARVLAADDVPFRLVVEDDQYEKYLEYWPPENIIRLPFNDGGDGYKVDFDGVEHREWGGGAVPARNFIRRFAEDEGHAKHWQFDDNIRKFRMLVGKERIPIHAGAAIRLSEDFADRYANMGLCAINYAMMAVPGSVTKPVRFNHYCYSATLINHEMNLWWRGRYNDDTDLCLQAMSQGWCTAHINVVLVDKVATMTMSGGMQVLYDKGIDGRLRMANELARLWPGTVKRTRRFGRPQHYVDWDKFDIPIKLKEGVKLEDFPTVDQYDLVLTRVSNRGNTEQVIEAAKKLGWDASHV